MTDKMLPGDYRKALIYDLSRQVETYLHFGSENILHGLMAMRRLTIVSSKYKILEKAVNTDDLEEVVKSLRSVIGLVQEISPKLSQTAIEA